MQYFHNLRSYVWGNDINLPWTFYLNSFLPYDNPKFLESLFSTIVKGSTQVRCSLAEIQRNFIDVDLFIL